MTEKDNKMDKAMSHNFRK